MQYDHMKKLLNSMNNPVDKLELVMDFGAQLEPCPINAVCAEIVGCSSYVEICRLGNRFFGRADSGIVRGIVAILLAMIDGKTPEQIKKMEPGLQKKAL